MHVVTNCVTCLSIYVVYGLRVCSYNDTNVLFDYQTKRHILKTFRPTQQLDSFNETHCIALKSLSRRRIHRSTSSGIIMFSVFARVIITASRSLHSSLQLFYIPSSVNQGCVFAVMLIGLVFAVLYLLHTTT